VDTGSGQTTTLDQTAGSAFSVSRRSFRNASSRRSLRRDVYGRRRKPTDARMILALVADLFIEQRAYR
jgi:hypothetical protein